MLTQCPACLTIFRVTGPILRMGHGQVRCGRCETQFDALERLLDDEEQAAQTSEYPLTRAAPTTAIPKAELLAGPSAEGPLGTSGGIPQNASNASHDDYENIPLEQAHVAQSELDAPAHDEAPPQAPTKTEPGAAAATQQTEVPVDERLSAEAREPLNPASLTEGPAIRALRAANRLESASKRNTEDARDALDLLAAPRRPSRDLRALWTAASLVFAVALLVQISHHYRQDLARHPYIGPLLSQVYGALGRPLASAWDLSAYEVQQWGVTSDPTAAGSLRVRATVANLAGFAQPYPVLRFVLEDRWGDAVGTRDFLPQEYLEPGAAVDRLLAPNQRATVEVTIVDPGQDAVGFRWSVCMPLQDGLQCENDSAKK